MAGEAAEKRPSPSMGTGASAGQSPESWPTRAPGWPREPPCPRETADRGDRLGMPDSGPTVCGCGRLRAGSRVSLRQAKPGRHVAKSPQVASHPRVLQLAACADSAPIAPGPIRRDAAGDAPIAADSATSGRKRSPAAAIAGVPCGASSTSGVSASGPPGRSIPHGHDRAAPLPHSHPMGDALGSRPVGVSGKDPIRMETLGCLRLLGLSRKRRGLAGRTARPATRSGLRRPRIASTPRCRDTGGGEPRHSPGGRVRTDVPRCPGSAVARRAPEREAILVPPIHPPSPSRRFSHPSRVAAMEVSARRRPRR
jgi:hypothetical protein